MVGTTELVLILIMALLLFDEDELPELARLLGTSIKEFKKVQTDIESNLKGLVNCKNCSNLTAITEYEETKKTCKEKLEVKYDNHECHKYIP